MDIKRIRERIAELKRQRDQVVQRANLEIATLNGIIQGLEESLTEPKLPEDADDV